ncbi:PTS system mannose/fructose/N-acetylgalactosamine-transporter subunit IIB [Enterococcus faecalis]|uniref:PTS system mannose/fructose/N-acetylgalactosamine-transporter subunit IIB n=1 Tax=Enterococcus faecalis TaxID=1351 RepID=UPI0039A69863
MSISFVRIDDRMIHGLITLRWTKEMPCDGIIAVNDKAASNPILKEAYKAAAQDKKTFIWTMAHFFDVKDKVLASKSKYFLITKSPLDMKKILVDWHFVPSEVKMINVGPGNDSEGTIKLGDNQSFTAEEAAAFEEIEKAGYKVDFALLPDQRIGSWAHFKAKFGY